MAPDAIKVREFLSRRKLSLPPVVVTEILSHPLLPADIRGFVITLGLLPIRDGYWERAGFLRADLHARGLKAKLADCLIAQSCIDHDVPLITYDRDFRHFVRAGLTLA
jgi:hypothetical protein